MTVQHLPPRWQARLLAALGYLIEPQAHRLLTAWAQAEGGAASWNPLNTTYPLPWGSNSYNSSSVKNYDQQIQGLCATVLTLATSHNPDGKLTYGGILGFLESPKVTAEECVNAHADEFKTWGTNVVTLLEVLAGTD